MMYGFKYPVGVGRPISCLPAVNIGGRQFAGRHKLFCAYHDLDQR